MSDIISVIAARHAEDAAAGPFVGRRSEQARLDREALLEEIARLREERLTNEERGAICWARAGLLNDSEETRARGLRERSKHSREAAETLTRLLERQPLPPGPEGEEFR